METIYVGSVVVVAELVTSLIPEEVVVVVVEEVCNKGKVASPQSDSKIKNNSKSNDEWPQMP